MKERCKSQEALSHEYAYVRDEEDECYFIAGKEGPVGPTGPVGPVGPRGLRGAAAPNLFEIYRVNLSGNNVSYNVPIANRVYYQLYRTTGSFTVRLLPIAGNVTIDYKWGSFYSGGATDGGQRDSYLLTGVINMDNPLYDNSREMHRTWLRVQNPDTLKWALYVISMFMSGPSSRVTIWVMMVEEEVEYLEL